MVVLDRLSRLKLHRPWAVAGLLGDMMHLGVGHHTKDKTNSTMVRNKATNQVPAMI